MAERVRQPFGFIDYILFPNSPSVRVVRTPHLYSVGLVAFLNPESAHVIVNVKEGIDTSQLKKLTFDHLDIDLRDNRQAAMDHALSLLTAWRGVSTPQALAHFNTVDKTHANFDNSPISVAEEFQRELHIKRLDKNAHHVAIGPLLAIITSQMNQ